MTAEPETLPVLFCMSEGQCTAVFPTETWPNGRFTVYARIGQHGEAVKGWYNRTRKATPEQYADLLAELRGIYEHPHFEGDGVYRLKVIQRWPRSAAR